MNNITNLITEIRSLILSARKTISYSVNLLQVMTNFEIGRRIVEYEQNWSIRELKRQFNSSLFERLALSRDKDGIRQLSMAGQNVEIPEDLIKNPLVLEFLGIDEKSNIHPKEYQLYLPDKKILKRKLLQWLEEENKE